MLFQVSGIYATDKLTKGSLESKLLIKSICDKTIDGNKK